MTDRPVRIIRGLYPAACLYGMVTGLRNKLFDWGILPSESYGVPVICIGNLAVGGTGKTPHTEYLIRLLAKDYRVAVLSRGYKRKTRGFLLASGGVTADDIGDEPYQMYRKFAGIRVAVDEDRRHGIARLLADEKFRPDVILLDDAYQHRYVKAGLNLLLTDYHRLFCDDALLPAGRLREPVSGKDRAHVVVVTKCPPDLLPIQYTILRKKLALKPYQRLFFSTLCYGVLRPLFPDAGQPEVSSLSGRSVLLLTGIASPQPVQAELERQGARVHLKAFPDHHAFSGRELTELACQFGQMPADAVLVTTEKDATRLVHRKDLPDSLRQRIYVLPVEVHILQERQSKFNQVITDYVRENQ